MRLNKNIWLVVIGLLWFAAGIALLTLGMHWVVFFSLSPVSDASAVLTFLVSFAGGREQAALTWIIGGLILGFILGRWILMKATQELLARVNALESPVSFSQIYIQRYLILIGGVVGLGAGLILIPVSLEFKGLVNVVIGSGLINGAPIYLRSAFASSKCS